MDAVPPTKLRSKLEDLARNLWWSWQPDVVGLFEALDPETWSRLNHNPVALLEALGDQQLSEVTRV